MWNSYACWVSCIKAQIHMLPHEFISMLFSVYTLTLAPFTRQHHFWCIIISTIAAEMEMAESVCVCARVCVLLNKCQLNNNRWPKVRSHFSGWEISCHQISSFLYLFKAIASNVPTERIDLVNQTMAIEMRLNFKCFSDFNRIYVPSTWCLHWFWIISL